MRSTILERVAALGLLCAVRADVFSWFYVDSPVITYDGPTSNDTGSKSGNASSTAWRRNGTSVYPTAAGASVSTTVIGDNILLFGSWESFSDFELRVDGAEVEPEPKLWGPEFRTDVEAAWVEKLKYGPHSVVLTAKKGTLAFSGFGSAYNASTTELRHEGQRYFSNSGDSFSWNGTWSNQSIASKAYPDMITSVASSSLTITPKLSLTYIHILGAVVANPGPYTVSVEPPPPFDQEASVEYHPERSALSVEALKAGEETAKPESTLHTVALDAKQQYTITITFLGKQPQQLALRNIRWRAPGKEKEKKERPLWILALLPIFFLVIPTFVWLFLRYRKKRSHKRSRPEKVYSDINIDPNLGNIDDRKYDGKTPFAARPAFLGGSVQPPSLEEKDGDGLEKVSLDMPESLPNLPPGAAQVSQPVAVQLNGPRGNDNPFRSRVAPDEEFQPLAAWVGDDLDNASSDTSSKTAV